MNHYDVLEKVARLGPGRNPAIHLAGLLALFDSPPVTFGKTVTKCTTCKGKGIVSCVKYPCLCGVCGGTGFVIRKWSDV